MGRAKKFPSTGKGKSYACCRLEDTESDSHEETSKQPKRVPSVARRRRSRSRPSCLPAVCEEWKYNFTKCNLSISTLLLKVFQCWYDFSSAGLWGRTTGAEGETFEGVQ